MARCCQFVDWIQFNCVDEIFKSRTKFLWCLHRFAAEIVIFTILQWLVAMITQPNLADVVSIKNNYYKKWVVFLSCYFNSRVFGQTFSSRSWILIPFTNGTFSAKNFAWKSFGLSVLLGAKFTLPKKVWSP